MLRKTARWLLAVCVAGSGFAFAEEQSPARTPEPQALSDAELEGITAGAITFGQVSVFNPGKADVFKQPHNLIICINCFNSGSNPETTGAMFLITPAGMVGPKCIRSC